MYKRANGLICNGRGRDRGSVAATVAVLLIILLGFAALGTEVVYAMFKQRQMQAVADSAALAGATAIMTGRPADPAFEARAVATTMGFTQGAAGATVTVQRPPMSGPYAGSMLAIEVIISQPQPSILSSLFRSGPWDVGARAVASAGNQGVYCVLALDPSAPAALAISENASLTSGTCGAASNSNSASSIKVDNNGSINGPVSTVGNWALGVNGSLNNPQLSNYAPPVPDPYAGVRTGTVPPCTGQSGTAVGNSIVNLMPGHFCEGWDFENNVTLNLAPGTYYIDSELTIGNNGILQGTAGVTLVINGDYAINLGQNSNIDLVAPSTGAFAGMAMVDLSTASGVTQVFSNNVVFSVTGAIYLRNQTARFENNGMTATGGCTQIIARIIQIQNSAELDNNCQGVGTQPIGTSPSHLVE